MAENENKSSFSYLNDGFNIYLSKLSPPRTDIARYFGIHQKRFGFDKMRHVLSVGSNDGSLDVCILKHFPNCQLYTAIEPCQRALGLLEHNLKNHHPSIERHLVNSKAECWQGPKEKANVIVASFVMQYFENKQDAISTFLSWLKPEGYIVFIHMENDIICRARGLLKPQFLQDLVYWYDDLKSDVENMQCILQIVDDANKYRKFQTNLRDVPREFASWVYGKICTDEEMDEVIKCFQTLAPSGISDGTTGILVVKRTRLS